MNTRDYEQGQLQHDLAERLDAWPMSEWSPAMLRAVIGVFDAVRGAPGPKPGPPSRLKLITAGDSDGD